MGVQSVGGEGFEGSEARAHMRFARIRVPIIRIIVILDNLECILGCPCCGKLPYIYIHTHTHTLHVYIYI